MAQNVNPTFVKTPNTGATQITTGTGSSGLVTIYTGAVSGSKISALIAVSVGTTSAFDVQWGVTSGSTFYMYGTVAVSAAAGSTDSLPSVSMLNSANTPGLALDSDGNAYLFLASTAWLLQAKTPATSSTWATGAVINLIAPSIGDF